MSVLLFFSEEPVLAEGLRAVLKAAGDITLEVASGSAGTLDESLERRNPNALLFDFYPEEHFGLLMRLRATFPRHNVIVWTRSMTFEAAYQVMKGGVRGILRKTAPVESLLSCIRTVMAGDLWFEKQLTRAFLEARTFQLTPRESQLVVLVSQGLKNKEIATVLGIAEPTVRVYLTALFRKVGARDRYELALYGMRNLAVGSSASADASIRGVEHGAAVRPGLRFMVLERPSSQPSREREPGKAVASMA